MLTQEQRKNLCAAVRAWNHGLDMPGASGPDEVIATNDTLADFISAWGEPSEWFGTPEGILIVWQKVQARKGAPRGDLFVMDFGEARACAGDAILR